MEKKFTESPLITQTFEKIEGDEETESPKSDFGVLVVVLTSFFLDRLLFMNIAAFMPSYVAKNHPSISSFQIGVLFSCFPLAQLVACPWTGNNMAKYGRKNILTTAMLLSSLSALVFGAASYIQDSQNFYLMSAAARTILGFGEGMAMTCVPAIIAAEFAKEHQLKYQSYYTMSQSLGLTLGPLTGALIYDWIGYAGTFYFFAVIMLISSLFCQFYVPKHLNYRAVAPAVELDTDDSNPITYCKFIMSLPVLILLLVTYNNMNNLCYVDPTLGPQLNKLGAPDIYTGYAFGIESGCCFFGGAVAIYIFMLINMKWAVQIACLLQTFSLMFLGPSQFFGFESTVQIMFFGYGLNGFASGILFVPIYPMLVTLMDPDSSNNNLITDKCSAVLGMTYSLAQILSPILGGYFTDIVGFQSASDIFMAFSFTVSVLYAFVLCSQGERI